MVLWIVLIVIVIFIAIFIGIVMKQPAPFRIVRSATMAAPAHEIFEQVNDLHHWENWSPWAKLDPDMNQTYEGEPSGTGAVHTWEGNKKVGQGRMTIVESHPHDLIRIKLEFIKPFKATNIAEFQFKPSGDQTDVEWIMTGRNDTFMAKAFSLVMNMDKMLGKEFDKGLATLKERVETHS